jgi:2-iminoacetate synthase ThiH
VKGRVRKLAVGVCPRHKHQIWRVAELKKKKAGIKAMRGKAATYADNKIAIMIEKQKKIQRARLAKMFRE